MFNSIYSNREDGVSIVDPVAQEKYKKDTASLRRFESQISHWASIYISNAEMAFPYAECVTEWLYRWAQNEALLGKANPQGQAVRKWTLATFSSAFVQISDDERLPSQQVRIVKAWLNLIAQNVRNEYSRQLENRTRQNNHMYWAAWATMITSVLVDDTDMFDWSVDKLKFAINQISDDGTLPFEMERMGKAFNYHVFAAGPLIMMAETAEKNGINIYEFRKGALKNLINRILTELETDQAYITQTLDRKQNIEGTLTPGQLAWMEPYYMRFKEPRMEKWLDHFRPMIQRRLGGNLSQHFAEP